MSDYAYDPDARSDETEPTIMARVRFEVSGVFPSNCRTSDEFLDWADSLDKLDRDRIMREVLDDCEIDPESWHIAEEGAE